MLQADFEVARNSDATLHEKILEEIVELQMTQVGYSHVDTIEEILQADVDYCKVLSISFDKQKLLRGKEYFQKREGVSLITSHPLNFELVGSSTSKGNALEYLMSHLHIPLDHVMAIGDNYNDISMFQKAGISVAMGNAEKDIQEICSFTSLSNDLHGVSHAIRQYLHLFG
jgi:hypothetical protein